MDQVSNRIALVVLGCVALAAIVVGAVAQAETGVYPAALSSLAGSALGAIAAYLGSQPRRDGQ